MMMKIGEVFCLIRNGASIKQSDGASGIPITRIETISNRIVDRNKFGYANISNASEYQDYLLQDGDILMSHINSEKHLGKTALYRKYSGEQIIHGMNLLLLRPNAEILLADYAMYILNSEMFLRQLPRITKKSVNQASFNISALKELDVYIPSINRQKEIVSVLDKVDAMLERYKTQFKRLDDLVKSRFVEMFGEMHSRVYETKKLREFCKFQQGTQVPIEEQIETQLEGYTRFLRIIDYTQAPQPPRYVSVKGKKIEEDSVVVVRYGATAGFVGHGYAGILANNLFEVIPDEATMSKEFLYLTLKHGTFEQEVHDKAFGAAMPALSFGMMNDIIVAVPSKQAQNEFIVFVKQVDKSKLAVKQSLEKLETLKKSLMQQYFG